MITHGCSRGIERRNPGASRTSLSEIEVPGSVANRYALVAERSPSDIRPLTNSPAVEGQLQPSNREFPLLRDEGDQGAGYLSAVTSSQERGVGEFFVVSATTHSLEMELRSSECWGW